MGTTRRLSNRESYIRRMMRLFSLVSPSYYALSGLRSSFILPRALPCLPGYHYSGGYVISPRWGWILKTNFIFFIKLLTLLNLEYCQKFLFSRYLNLILYINLFYLILLNDSFEHFQINISSTNCRDYFFSFKSLFSFKQAPNA